MKKSYKNMLALSLVFCIFATTFPFSVSANDYSPEIMPIYTGVMNVRVGLDVSINGYASPKASVSLCNGYSADVTLQLCYDSDEIEYTWTTSGSGMLTLNKAVCLP